MITPSDEKSLDDILNSIDSLSEKVCQRANKRKTGHQKTKRPTSGFDIKKLKETRMAFSALAEEKLLESRDPEAGDAA